MALKLKLKWAVSHNISTKIQIIRYLLGIKHYDSNDLKLKKV